MKYLLTMLSVIAVLLSAPVVTAQDSLPPGAPPARDAFVNDPLIPDGAVFYHMVAMYQDYEENGLRV